MISNSPKIVKRSGIYTLTAKQIIPISLDTAWEFFTNPKNLERITPSFMKFAITSAEVQMPIKPGHIISYRVSPFRWYRAHWVSEISHVVEKELFVDEQRFGPYRFWHHKHYFNEVNAGVLIKDEVSYKPPFPLGMGVLNQLFIAPRLEAIFEYRSARLNELFSK